MKNRIAPSILSADFKRLGEQLKETEAKRERSISILM